MTRARFALASILVFLSKAVAGTDGRARVHEEEDAPIPLGHPVVAFSPVAHDMRRRPAPTRSAPQLKVLRGSLADRRTRRPE